MTGPNSLYPAFVQIHYTSAWGKHVQTIPTKAYTIPGGSFTDGSYVAWDTSVVDAGTMVNTLLNDVAVIADAGIAWNYAIFYTYPAPPPGLPNPVHIMNLSQVGAVTHSVNALAYQNTYTFYDTAFGTFKFVLLDMDPSLSLEPSVYAGLNSAHKAVVDDLTDTHWAWSSRLGNAPSTLRKVVSKPNDKLRREYLLT